MDSDGGIAKVAATLANIVRILQKAPHLQSIAKEMMTKLATDIQSRAMAEGTVRSITERTPAKKKMIYLCKEYNKKRIPAADIRMIVDTLRPQNVKFETKTELKRPVAVPKLYDVLDEDEEMYDLFFQAVERFLAGT